MIHVTAHRFRVLSLLSWTAAAVFAVAGTAAAQQSFRAMSPDALVQAWTRATRSERPQIVDALLQNRALSLLALRGSALTDAAPEAREFAVGMLAAMRDSGALPAVLAATRDGDLKVRKRAIDALRRLADTRGAPRLRELVKSNQDRGILKLSMIALGKLGANADVARLRPFLNDADESVRVVAAGSLAMLGDLEGQDLLLEATHSGNPMAQKNATYALGFVDTPAATARLQEILDDPQGHWKSYAAMALAQQDLAIAPPDMQAQQLAKLAGGQDRQVTDWALERLTDLGTPEAVAETAKLANRAGRVGWRAQLQLALTEGR